MPAKPHRNAHRPPLLLPCLASVALAVSLAALSAVPHARAYEERGLEPTADYPSLPVARDSIGKIIDRVVVGIGGPKHKSIRVSRTTARFRYWYARDTTDGWVYTIVVSDTSECPMTRLEYALDAAGWTVHNAYVADGADGGVMGFVSKRHFCYIEGHWDGGDDSDRRYVPVPGCSLSVVCVPRRTDDVPR